jgi:hypothetical protein
MNAWDAKASVGARVIVNSANYEVNGVHGTIVMLGPSPLGARPAWALVDLDRGPEWGPRRYWLTDLEMESSEVSS